MLALEDNNKKELIAKLRETRKQVELAVLEV